MIKLEETTIQGLIKHYNGNEDLYKDFTVQDKIGLITTFTVLKFNCSYSEAVKIVEESGIKFSLVGKGI